MNKRVEIRSAFRTALSGNTSALANVYSSRTGSIWESGFPCIVIYDTNEQNEDCAHQGLYKRKMTLIVDARAKSEDAIDDVLDAFGNEIESAIISSADDLFQYCERIRQISSEKEINYESEIPVGSLRISYEVTYLTD